MSRFDQCFLGWCQRCVTMLVVGALLVSIVTVLAAAKAPSADSPSQLWAQLLQTGVILVVAGAVIRMFFTFKDEAVKQAGQDREAARVGLDKVETKMDELTHALMGVGGYGGLLQQAKLDAERRHELANQIVRMHDRIHSLAEQVERLARRVGEPFDPKLLED
jgi:flagellar basal body-associated protein FliL